MVPARRTPRFAEAWHRAREIAGQQLHGRNDLHERSIRYLDERCADAAAQCLLVRKEVVNVVDAGRYEFFREPTPEELVELAAAKFDECERHAERLRAQAKRKRLARKKRAKRTAVASR